MIPFDSDQFQSVNTSLFSSLQLGLMASATMLIENGSVQAPVRCGGNVVGGDCGSGSGRGCRKSDLRGVGERGATINNKKRDGDMGGHVVSSDR
ncbi:hypothetical protein L6452_05478 [Arctium lappa]|uniref:Uncharacterized protein n=1 Tax=Arctium lappa TaxID=4217 RepID=A0ACB9EG89_ARCLA|nr:hypothetical protein L6452_05478 [Arctium lappa]